MNQSTPLSIRLDELLWAGRLDQFPSWKGRLIKIGRLIYALIRDLTQGYLTLQAMSLVYTTLLSMVPLLAVSFSVLKGFGAHNMLEPMLLQALAPLGEKGTEISQSIIGFVDNMNVKVLGSLGLVILLFTVLSLIQKIEQVFNYTWHCDEGRPFAQRFSQYLSVLMVGPILFFTAVGLSASVRSSSYVNLVLAIEPFGTLIDVLSQFVPFLMLALTFSFIYVFVPNTRVRLRSAMIGALVAAFLWQTLGWIFAHFMVSSTQYTAIYSGLAIPILFMIWIYIAWLILLVGASIAFYHQHPEYLSSRSRDLHLSNRLRERLALLVAGHVSRNYMRDLPAWNAETLSAALGVPKVNTIRILNALETAGYVVRTVDQPPCYLPAHAPDGVLVKSLLDSIRCFEEQESGCRGTAPDPGIEAIETRLNSAMDRALDGMTLKDLAAALDGPRSAVREELTSTQGGSGARDNEPLPVALVSGDSKP